MAFPLNSNNPRVLPDDSGYNIGVHFYSLLWLTKSKKPCDALINPLSVSIVLIFAVQIN